MENRNDSLKNENEKEDQALNIADEEKVEFENPSVDPGFENSGTGLSGREDKREGDIDSNKSIKDMQENKQNDALNYKNDRENGAYNPKNI